MEKIKYIFIYSVYVKHEICNFNFLSALDI